MKTKFISPFISGMMLVVLIFTFSHCGKKGEEDKEVLLDKITATSIGLAYLEENRLDDAEITFKRLVEIAPDESMGYANLGLVYLRMGKYEDAFAQLNKAIELDPNNPDIRLILAKTYEQNMQSQKAVEELRNIIKIAPDFAKAYYGLAEYYSKSDDPESRQLRAEKLKKTIELIPANIVPRLQLIELLAINGKADECLAQMEELKTLIAEFPQESEEYYDQAVQLLRQGKAEEAITPIRIFHNFLKLIPQYQSGMTEVKGPGGELIGFPIITTSSSSSFVSLDGESILGMMKFVDVNEAVGLNMGDLTAGGNNVVASCIAVTDYEGDGDIDIYYSRALEGEANSKYFLLNNELGSFTDVTLNSDIKHEGIEHFAIFGDYDNDGKEDLLVNTNKGNLLYKNEGEGKFDNVTESTGIGKSKPANRSLFVDVDHDGDLDIYFAESGENELFRNNGDGTFTEFAGSFGLTGGNVSTFFTGFGDFDDDGDVDLFNANKNGHDQLLSNLRMSKYEDITDKANLANTGGTGIGAIADYNNDGMLDLLTTSQETKGLQILKNKGDGTFERDIPSSKVLKDIKEILPNDARFYDFDNDGHQDLIIAGNSGDRAKKGLFLFHNDSIGKFSQVSHIIPETVKEVYQIAVADFNSDGDLDLFLACSDGIKLVRNETGNMNHYIKVQLVGLTNGNGKNNHFGIGAKLELKAGELYQMKMVTEPVVHFGIGSKEEADILRIVWTNGVPQNIISPKSDQDLIEEQLLKGSCPFLYTWNGEKYVFVKDMMWRSALGMPLGIMGGKRQYAFPDISTEYLKIPGEMLKPKDGRYSLKITEELWEAVYFDKASLTAVDHPENVDFFVDERFTLPPFAGKRLYQVPEKHLPVAVTDNHNNNLLPFVSEKDDRYISHFQAGKYQGLTEMKDLIIDLGAKAHTDSLFLFLQGWIFPTDASINYSISQNQNYKPVAPYLQVLNKNGEWQTVIESIGFPMGKDKTVVVDLTNKFLTNDRKVKISTNMQIYWDHIFFSECAPGSPVRMTDLTLKNADLHFRGYSASYRKGGRYGPHWFDYYDVSDGQKWRDLTGYYTRYGDVLPLVDGGDDKYVIANAGDEISFEFDARQLPDLPDGWTRDFLIYSEGWVKDGDLNTATGQTVEPLPFRNMSKYPYGQEEHYPAGAEYREYQETYNTRKVTTEGFRNALKPQ